MKSLILACILVLGTGLIAQADEVFGGVGMVMAQDHGKTIVQDLIPNAPAARAGVRIGDILVKINEQDVGAMNLDTIVGLIRGPVGSTVFLTFNSAGAIRNFTLAREQITIACFLEGNINLRTNAFNNQTMPTSINGYIGSNSANGMISFNGGITFYVKGHSYFLNLMKTGFQERITGYINGNYISWFGNNGWFTGYQPCIN